MNNLKKRIIRKTRATNEIRAHTHSVTVKYSYYQKSATQSIKMLIAAEEELRWDNFEFYCRYGYFFEQD